MNVSIKIDPQFGYPLGEVAATVMKLSQAITPAGLESIFFSGKHPSIKLGEIQAE